MLTFPSRRAHRSDIRHLGRPGTTPPSQPISYIRHTWFDSPVWEHENWSLYGQSVRTKSDVEDWHRWLNYRAIGTPPLYVLIDHLHREARIDGMQVQLVPSGKVRRYQGQTYRAMQTKISRCWHEYDIGDFDVWASEGGFRN